MKADTLKKSILQWAIEGKLVPQLESEPEVKQIGEAPEDVPFAIPEKWKWISASYVQTLVRGITFPASAKTKMQTHNSICCLTTGSVQEKYASKADVFVDQSFMKNTRQILQVGDVVISSANSKELVGKSILWEDKSGIQKTFGGFLTVARVKDSQSVIPEYLFLVYRYMFKTGYFANLSTQTTNIANLSNKLLDALAFPIPPLGEQQRLVAKLNKLLPLVETYGKEQEALEKLEKEFPDKLRASLLQEAIQGKLVPQLESEPEVEQIGDAPEQVPFEIPDKWKWGRLQDVGSFISGWTPKAEELQKMCSIGCVPYFKIADMNQQGNEIWLQKTSSFLKKSERTRTFFRGTIVYPKNGGAVFTNKRRLLNQESVVDLNTGGYVPGKFLDIGYAYNIFLGLDFRTISKGTALPTLDQTKLRNYLIPLPPLAEQRRIVARVNELLSLLDELH